MRSIFICLILLLFLSASASSNNRGTPWQVSWPFFQNANVPHSLTGGYGDWCVIDEGAHPGLDFGAIPGDSVLVPSDMTRHNLAIFAGLGYTLVFGTDSNDQEGWGVAHLAIRNIFIEPFTPGSEVYGHQPLAPCSLYSSSAPLHMHLQWVDNLLSGSPPGLHNPFDFFENNLSGYDEIQFNPVRWEGYKRTGAWFMPDGTESAAQISGLTDYQLFQDIVSGAVDIAVSPFSAFQGSSDQDMAGVYSVSYEILRQNPHTLEYEPAAPDEGNFGERFLMEMRDELPHGNSPGYRALFPDGQLPDGGGALDPFWWYNMNAYIITNSGALDPSEWGTGWNNVYTAKGYTNSWADGICQGAWDTFLANPDISGDPVSNREAFFPDGRYAVEVTAVSHGSRESGSMMLPVDDLAGSPPETQGIIVDNFLPSVGAVIIYSSEAGEPSSVEVKYIAKWVQGGGLDTTGHMEQLAYLEELREDLRFFQSLERGEEVSETFRTHPDFWNESFRAGSACRMPISTEIAENGLNSSSDVEDQGIAEGAGRDPVEFLQEEIIRIEGELDFQGRNLLAYGYGYIPYEGMGDETLNMLVIYSEPTMVESFTGFPLTDVIWMRGYIHDEILWDSRNHGNFVRDTPVGNAEHTSFVQEHIGSAFPSEPDAAYAVHYTFQGDLPSEFCGSIQILIGSNSSSSTSGPRDLAGHPTDGDPATIPPTRQGYESWSSTSPGYYPNYESQSKGHYYWGVPYWSVSDGTAFAHIVADTVAEVNLAAIGLQDACFYGRCLPWYGFWMYQDEEGVCGFDIPVVRHDGTVLHHEFTTKFPKGNPSTSNQFWSGGPNYSSTGPPTVVSRGTRYFWMAGGNVRITRYTAKTVITSDAYVYCVDSWTGAEMSSMVAYGSDGAPNKSDIEGPDAAYSEICEVYKSGAALVAYSNPDDELSFTILDPPGGGVDSIEESPSTGQLITSAPAGDRRSFAVLANPVHETLDVTIFGESGENWNLAVFDLSGRCLLSDHGISGEGGSVQSIGTGSLPSGIYMLRVEAGGVEEVQSITVMH